MNNQDDALTVYSMFAGIGGIDLGMHATKRFQTKAFSEIDEYACKALAHHFPNTPNIGDCSTTNYTDWPHGTIDVIAAGFPCQDISVAGKQEGIEHGTRSGLWDEVVRATRNLRPRYLLLENVAAITTSNQGADLGRVLGDLATLGYDAEWSRVRASDVGAPHQRARWFCIAWSTPRDTVADASSRRRQNDRLRTGRSQPRRNSPPLADSPSARPQRHRQPIQPPRKRDTSPRRVFTPPHPNPYWNTGTIGPGGRLIEPGIRLLANGIPDRVAQLRCYGNAVVPQVAEHVARCLLALHDNPPHARQQKQDTKNS